MAAPIAPAIPAATRLCAVEAGIPGERSEEA